MVFCLVASAIIISGRYHSGYRLGQYVTQGIHSRVDFSYADKAKLAAAQQRARELEPRVYKRNPQFSWTQIEEQMRRWPEILAGRDAASLPEAMRTSLDPSAMALLAQYQAPERKALYAQRLETFFAIIRKLVVLPVDQHNQEIARHAQWRAPSGFAVRALDDTQEPVQLPLDRVFSLGQEARLLMKSDARQAKPSATTWPRKSPHLSLRLCSPRTCWMKTPPRRPRTRPPPWFWHARVK